MTLQGVSIHGSLQSFDHTELLRLFLPDSSFARLEDEWIGFGFLPTFECSMSASARRQPSHSVLLTQSKYVPLQVRTAALLFPSDSITLSNGSSTELGHFLPDLLDAAVTVRLDHVSVINESAPASCDCVPRERFRSILTFLIECVGLDSRLPVQAAGARFV